MHHRATQCRKSDIPRVLRQVTCQAAREAVPGTGRIVNIFERKGGAAKELPVLAEEQAAVLPFLMATY